MSLFRKREAPKPLYPTEQFEPVIRSSICTGERVACMRERQTGRVHELMLLRSDADLERFCEEYGVCKDAIRTIY